LSAGVYYSTLVLLTKQDGAMKNSHVLPAASPLIISIVLIVSEFSCKNNPVEPSSKDPRTLSWTVDTIVVPNTYQTVLGTVWGSSAKDVYLTGTTSNTAVLYRFDGLVWRDAKMARSSRGRYDIQLIRGFGPNNIWFIGSEWYFNFSPPPNWLDSTLVLQFDGTNWTQHLTEKREGRAEKWCAQNSNNLWIGGRKTLWNFKDRVWTQDTIPLVTAPQGFCGIHGLALDNSGNLFVTFYYRPVDAGPNEQYYFLSRKSGQWTLIDSAVIQPGRIEYKWGYNDLWFSPSGDLYSIGHGVYKWDGASWMIVQQGAYSLINITATGDAGFLVVGTNGAILHFNGGDWYRFAQFEDNNMMYTDIWTDGKEVFITGIPLQGNYSVILRGR
jgi:hypothetical protein